MRQQAAGDSYVCSRTGELKQRTSSGSSHVCTLSPRGGVIDADCIVTAAAAMLSRNAAAAFPCKHLALTLSGFVAKPEGKREITSFFGAMAAAAAATAAAAAAASGAACDRSPAKPSATASDDDESFTGGCSSDEDCSSEYADAADVAADPARVAPVPSTARAACAAAAPLPPAAIFAGGNSARC